jgi:hypothetical protein
MTANTPPAKGQPQAAPALQPFRRGTQPTILSTGYVQTLTMTANTQDLPTWQIPPSNILRCIYLEVTGTTSANAATVTFASPDAPLNIFSTVNFADAGGTSIVGSFDSYTVCAAAKYFGFQNNADVRNSAVYSATTGAGATAGSFNFVVRIPVEVVSRTGIASLSNQSTNSPLTLNLTLNKSSAIYGTAPTTLPTVVVTARLGGYWKGSNAAASQTPVAFGTTSYINRASYMGLNGSVTQQLSNLGLGNPIRGIMFMNYATGAARSDANFPNPVEVDFRGNKLYGTTSQNLWKDELSRTYQFNNSTLDAANGLDTGVYVIPFCADFDLGPGSETGNGYLATNVGDSIQLIGTFAASSTLYEVINFLAVKGAPGQVQA